MIVDMPKSSTAEIAAKLVELKENGSGVALGRVLTLVIMGDEPDPELDSHEDTTDAESAIAAASEASREHPSRVLVLTGTKADEPIINAQIRVGSDAGASEVVLLQLGGPLRDQTKAVITPLITPDAPIVAWWPHHAPECPGKTPVGSLARLRITDSTHCSDGEIVLKRLAQCYQAGDTDLAWARLTAWRAQIAAALDLPPFDPVKRAVITGRRGQAESLLLAGWFAVELDCPVVVQYDSNAKGISSVVLERDSGDVSFKRPDGRTLEITQPGLPPRKIALPPTTLSEALIEELRRLDADKVYEKVLTIGIDRITIAKGEL